MMQTLQKPLKMLRSITDMLKRTENKIQLNLDSKLENAEKEYLKRNKI